MTIRVVDHGANALVRSFNELKSDRSVKVGVFGDRASAAHTGSDETVGDIAAKHEFGIDVPRRSFLRDYIDKEQQNLLEMLKTLEVRVLEGKMSEEAALELFGIMVVGGIQERITQGIAPPNAQSTKDRKGSSTPLIDKSQLLQSIASEVL